MLNIENTKYLVAALAKQLNLPELALDEDFCCFIAFDGQVINLQHLNDQIYLTIHVATLSQEEPATLYATLLATNLYGVGTRGAFISLESESLGIVLQKAIDNPDCSIDYLLDQLENLLSSANYLREQIARKQEAL